MNYGNTANSSKRPSSINNKFWVDNDVYDLIDLRKHPARNFVKGRWVLIVKRDKDGKFITCTARWVLKVFNDKKLEQQSYI